MKHKSKRLGGVFLILLMSTNFLFAQKNEKVNLIVRNDFTLLKIIELNSDSEEQEIEYPISENKASLILQFYAEILSGTLTIELYDPTGEKIGKYAFKNQSAIKTDRNTINSSKNEPVSGLILKSIESPITGKWKVKIIPKSVTGTLKIESKN